MRWRSNGFRCRTIRAFGISFARTSAPRGLRNWNGCTKIPCRRPPGSPTAAGAIDELGPGDIVGVYGLEEFGGRRFRWTEPVAMIRMAARQTACELRLETGGIRGDPLAFLIAVAVAGRALPAKYCTSDDKGTLTIHLPAAFAAAAKDGVVPVCEPLVPAREGIPDPRTLGLPIMSIAIHPLRN